MTETAAGATEAELTQLQEGGWFARGELKWERDCIYVDEEIDGEVIHEQTIGFVPKVGKWEFRNYRSKAPPDRSGIYVDDPFDDEETLVNTLGEAIKEAEDWW